MHTADRPYTPVVEDYLKAIWMLQQVEAPVSTSRIAERLSLTAAEVRPSRSAMREVETGDSCCWSIQTAFR